MKLSYQNKRDVEHTTDATSQITETEWKFKKKKNVHNMNLICHSGLFNKVVIWWATFN